MLVCFLRMSARDATDSEFCFMMYAGSGKCLGGVAGDLCTCVLHAPSLSTGIQQLLVSLDKLSPMLEGRDDDLQFLRDMLVSNEFHSLMTVSRPTATYLFS